MITKQIERFLKLQFANCKFTLQEMSTYPTKREKEHHRTKSAGWEGDMLVPMRVNLTTNIPKKELMV